jgi:hypothetical protein
MLKYHRNSDICKYKKQRNRVNNLKKIAKENFEINLDNIILENASNNKTYCKIMKMLLKSNKGSGNFPPLQNIINDQNLEEFAYDDEEKCDLLNKYFSFIFKLDEANATLAGFQFVGYLLWWSDLLNIICKGNSILFGHSFNILWLMTSCPDALFGRRI